MNIAVDVAGGDHAPYEIIDGALAALRYFPTVTLTLIGKNEVISEYLKNKTHDKSRLFIVNATETITSHEAPAVAVKAKRDSTLVVGAGLIKDKKCDALISAGSTGAILASSLLHIGRIKGVLRPALCPIIPTSTGCAMIIDGGANMDCKPAFLVQFALMGSIFMDKVIGKSNPKVCLLNVGAEEKMGNELTKEVYQDLKSLPGINFIGNLEGRDITNGDADVVVCDGFSGNVLLKTIEGMGVFMGRSFGQIFSGLPGKIAGGLVIKKINALKKRMSYEEHGGSPLLGIDGVVIKMHGTSRAGTVMNSVKQAMNVVENGVVANIKEQLKIALNSNDAPSS